MKNWTKEWITEINSRNNNPYSFLPLQTEWGTTSLMARNHDRKDLEPILFIPGFRTCGLFWDIQKNISPYYDTHRIYLLDVLGQPGLSHTKAPAIKSDGLGKWLGNILAQLEINSINIAGTSFGCFLIFKLAYAHPKLIKKAFLLNPVGIQTISLSPSNLYFNILPVIKKSRKSMEIFLDKVVFNRPDIVSREDKERLITFLYNTIKFDKLKADYPYKLKAKELHALTAETYLIQDLEDKMINQKATKKRALKELPNLQETISIPNIGHGMEFSKDAIQHIFGRIQS